MADSDLKSIILKRAQGEGFDAVGFACANQSSEAAQRLSVFIEAGRHGDMGWLETTAERRGTPQTLWPEARTVIMLGMNYGPDRDPLLALENRHAGAISVYAQGRDYHDVIKGKLKTLAGWLHARTGAEVKVFVDTAPVMEKPLAQAAGLGWQGKHTNLVSREFGSWLFLGAILTTAVIEPDAPYTDHCGSCSACLDICPTAAFPVPYQLDARRCISYLTIEHKGHIPHEFRRAIGNRIYGCDDCLAVCPWNKFANTAREAKFAANAMTREPLLVTLLALDDAAFRAAYSGSPIKRIGRNRFIRNVLIAAGNSGAGGNSGDSALIPHAIALLGDQSALVRAAAIWALGELLNSDKLALDALKSRHQPQETDADARAEWETL
ncbi:MAG: tRNA epoxyqueuosine(34) reductase QueG [Chitinophagales bacterium]|nr:tRNA epoxyqueuosine(34) reductase QueG [Hyphomicrobiales bacterium]